MIRTTLAALAVAPLAMTPAEALEPRQCLSMAEMNVALRAEGQRTLIIGDRSTVHDDRTRSASVRVDRFVNTITSNDDGSVGYQLEGNRPRAEISTLVCVGAKLTNIVLYDARLPRIPESAYLGGEFSQLVRENAGRGTRPMLMADTLHRNPDRTERRGLPLIVFWNMAGRSGSIVTAMSDLRPLGLALMAHVDYTAAALERLNRPPQQ